MTVPARLDLPGSIRVPCLLSPSMSILRFLGLQGEKASDDSTETVRKIVQALDQMEPQQAHECRVLWARIKGLEAMLVDLISSPANETQRNK